VKHKGFRAEYDRTKTKLVWQPVEDPTERNRVHRVERKPGEKFAVTCTPAANMI